MKRSYLLVLLLCVSSGCLFSPSGDKDGGLGRDMGGSDGGNADPGDMRIADGALVDVEIPPNCGDGLLQPEETCDPMLPATSAGACPTTCDDGVVCTADALVGAAVTCNAACQSVPIDVCQNGDGCCPSDCDAANDTDCDGTAVCGDGVVSGAELCDAGIGPVADGGCPKTEDCPAMMCNTTRVLGSRSTCNAECDYVQITACRPGDGCCPTGCDVTSDTDCTVSCGDGVIDAGELCDGNCPVDCDDGNACTDDILAGDPNNCDAVCVSVPIAVCLDGDMCCPSNCTFGDDADCSATCDNGSLEPNETCDNGGDAALFCPTDCDDADACTNDTTTGSPTNCNVVCTNAAKTGCTGDGCCVTGCNANNDPDCMPFCGNGTTEDGETCDGNCPDSCDDLNACTTDTAIGAAASCDRVCMNTPIQMCVGGDGCCPANCNANTDTDCGAVCGNQVVEGTELCDGDCPASCDDGDACTTDLRSGQSTSCNVQCTTQDVTTCIGGDGCCPSGCTGNNDSDCSATCGNGTTEAGEECDGSDCPTLSQCQAMGACRTLSGNAAQCSAVCTTIPGCVACSLTGNCPCGDGQVCTGGKCQTSSGGNCANACRPDDYCLTHASAPTCNEATNVCVYCQTNQDCSDWEQCSGGYCEVATDCTRAADPDGYCGYFQLGDVCDFQTKTCQWGCTTADDCLPTEECVGNFCMPASSCSQAADPDAWCGAGLVCINDNCELACNNDCDCGEPDQQCVQDAQSLSFYCEYNPPAFCWQACPTYWNEYCEDRYGIGAYCVSALQTNEGCIPTATFDMGGSDTAPPPDTGGGLPDIPSL